MKVIEPATEKVLAEIAEASVEDADRAVARAKAAYPAWRAVSPGDRAKLLRRFANAVADEAGKLAELEARNVGKPISDARGEVGMVVDVFNYYAGAPERLLGNTIPVAGGVDMTFREPLGVVALIVPWNFPIAITSWKLGPALAAGNTVVLKPAALTPMTALELEHLAVKAGIPEGVFKVVVGAGRTVGERLVQHPDVAKVAFTGSTEVGRRIGALAADSIKRVTLELGGKSANIVFADADIDRAAASAPGAVFGNAGQDCCARSRILVERSVADHHSKVATYLEDGAKVAIRGSAPSGAGFWFPPTVLSPVAPTDRAAREEIFGPIVAVIPFSDEADAIRIANDTVYGLSGSIWTHNAGRAMRVARALETGTISINSNTSVRVNTPFGGFKQSGIGRELGPNALDHYTELKNVFLSTT
ncbi:MAG: aldehyde dehydrogenase [Chloroflexi bacterium]|nr:MAG: aldehyde dehydrogenase [Chloroflexota bacterium]